jgi:NAD(P)-dependent dehydrogenase (short-subunit alcohol dehydrogenase family)
MGQVEPPNIGKLFSLEGRNALVTGASRGIGSRLAQVLDAAGARVVLVARDRGRLDELASGMHNDPVVLPADLMSAEEAREVAAEALRAVGRVDVLINNASLQRASAATDVTLEDWDATMSLNLRSMFVLAQALAPGMLDQQWGRVVNVASVMAFLGDTHAAAYAASKAGTLGLTRSLAVEWARSGVTVNALCPGWIDTDMVADLRADERFERRVTRSVPMRRWGQPQDMDGATLFLASPASDFMTGQAVVVDGGLTATW